MSQHLFQEAFVELRVSNPEYDKSSGTKMLRPFLVQSALLGIQMYVAVNLQNDWVLDAEEVAM